MWNIGKLDFFSCDVVEASDVVKFISRVGMMIVGKIRVRVGDRPSSKTNEVGMYKKSRAAVISRKKYGQQYCNYIAATSFFKVIMYILAFSHIFSVCKDNMNLVKIPFYNGQNELF